MPLSREEIETPRSPSQLCAFVQRVMDEVRSDPVELASGNQRRGYYKEFLDEVVPLASFAVHAYDETHTIQPVLGNQGYDAIVRGSTGDIVDTVEIANPTDGAMVAADARLVAKNGIGAFRVGDPGDEIEDLIPIVERIATKKAVKDYSDATVVFNVSALSPFKGFEGRHQEQILRIRSTLVTAGFKAKRVFLLHPPGEVERVDA